MAGTSMSTWHQGSLSLLQICFQYTDVKKALPGTNATNFGYQFSRSLLIRLLFCCSMSHPPCWAGKPKISVLPVQLCK